MKTRKLKNILLIIVHMCFFASSSNAHYLWVTIDREGGEHGIVNIYFEESPSVGDGYYLDSFEIATWIRTIENINPQPLATTDKRLGEKERWLSGKIPYSNPRGIESYGKFGVYRYGTTDVLLHYYARFLDVDSQKDLHELSHAEHMDLDIIPFYDMDDLKLKVLGKGKPVTASTVHIHGPNGFQVNLETDETGIVHFKIKDPGEYSFRTSFTENKAGRDDNKDYSSIRHNATLIMPLPLKE